MDFQNFVGNEKITQELSKAILENKVVNSYLWVGIKGIGKRTFANLFAKQLLCQTKKEDCHCDSCIKFNSSNHPDFLVVKPDGKNIKIEQIREMQEKVYEKPILGEKKVYLIEDAEKMRIEAQNCLLKTLEEPPSYAIIVLLTSNESGILLTIKSRCVKIPFEKIPDEKLKTYLLQNGFDTVTEEMLRLYDGSIGKALELKEKQEDYKAVVELVEKVKTVSLLEYVKASEILSKNKEDILGLLEYLMVLLYQKTKEDLAYRALIEIVEQAKIRLERNANFDMTIDQMLLKMWEEMNEKHHRS